MGAELARSARSPWGRNSLAQLARLERRNSLAPLARLERRNSLAPLARLERRNSDSISAVYPPCPTLRRNPWGRAASLRSADPPPRLPALPVLPPWGHPKNPPAPPCAGILGVGMPPCGRLIHPKASCAARAAPLGASLKCLPDRGVRKPIIIFLLSHAIIIIIVLLPHRLGSNVRPSAQRQSGRAVAAKAALFYPHARASLPSAPKGATFVMAKL